MTPVTNLSFWDGARGDSRYTAGDRGTGAHLSSDMATKGSDTCMLPCTIASSDHVKRPMKQIIAAAILSAASMSAWAGNGQGQNCDGNCNGNGGYRGAPGPVVGAGLPTLAFGIGYGVYWLRKRRRRKTTDV